MSTVLLSALRTRVRRAADAENDTARFPDAEVDEQINVAHKAFYDQLIDWAPEYLATTADTTTTAGSATVALPATLYRLLGVAAQISGTDWRWLDAGTLAGIYDHGSESTWSDVVVPRYIMHGTNIMVDPTPSAAYPIRYHYIPFATTITVSVEVVNGWDQAIVLRAALALARKDADTELASLIHAELQEEEQRLRKGVTPRDIGAPHKVSDVRFRRWTRARYR